MLFTCSRAKLYEALSILSSIVPTRSAKPILQNICFEGVDKNRVEMTVTDLEVGMRYSLEVEDLKDPETVLLPSMELNNIVRDAWGDSLTLEVIDSRAKLTTEAATFNIPGEAAENFPKVPTLEEADATEILAADLERAIKEVLFATAREEQQYSLAGVFISLEGKHLELVATDTFRLALSKKNLRKKLKKARTAIVLAKGMHELLRILPNEEIIKLQITNSQLFAQTSRATIVSRLIEGNFPQYANVIPKDLDKSITVDRTRLAEALRQAAHVANQETRAITFSAGDGKLEIKASSVQAGNASIEIEAEIEGGATEVSFNYTYLQDVLKVLQEETITLQIHDQDSPTRIDTKGYTYVVSPVCTRTGA
ncbi:MAG: DNA polymerase III subunit beta [Planctomycetes bacterium]|nr:DNA polymerase III subunit beta [Planctomycetota bacterium]